MDPQSLTRAAWTSRLERETALAAQPTHKNKRVERRSLLLVITGPGPVISRGTVLEQITGSGPVMTIGGGPG
jgi:hypothetical protein